MQLLHAVLPAVPVNFPAGHRSHTPHTRKVACHRAARTPSPLLSEQIGINEAIVDPHRADAAVEGEGFDGEGELGAVVLLGRVDRRAEEVLSDCLLYTSPSPRDRTRSRMPSSA